MTFDGIKSKHKLYKWNSVFCFDQRHRDLPTFPDILDSKAGRPAAPDRRSDYLQRRRALLCGTRSSFAELGADNKRSPALGCWYIRVSGLHPSADQQFRRAQSNW